MGQHLPLSFPGGRGAQRDGGGIAPRGRGRVWPAAVQAIVVLGGAMGMIAAPPATGRMLLVPLDGAGRDGLAQVAANAGAALVDAGPFHDSLIVSGDRSALLGAMMQGRMLVLRAADGGCGGKGQGL